MKFGEEWKVDGVLKVESLNVDGWVYLLKKPLKLAVHYLWKTTPDKDGLGSKIISSEWTAKCENPKIEISDSDWDDLMLELETVIATLASDGVIKVEVEG